MQHLQPFFLFESQDFDSLTPQQEKFLNRYTKGSWSVNPATGLVDVQGSFDCEAEKLESLNGIRFGTVIGDFLCDRNQLVSLEGSPQVVEGSFYCQFNLLTSLEGSPHKVGDYFDCSQNKINSLQGGPRIVGKGYNFFDNKVRDLQGSPIEVEEFSGQKNPIESLTGAPLVVKGFFSINNLFVPKGGWNLARWSAMLKNGNLDAEERALLETLPFLQVDYWLTLRRTNRSEFNSQWLKYRQDPDSRKTEIFKRVEEALAESGRENLDYLEDIGNFF
ncbi:hypothetical protein EBS02_03065 [bacterium]|nr:hypothetical protein [bacterium]